MAGKHRKSEYEPRHAAKTEAEQGRTRKTEEAEGWSIGNEGRPGSPDGWQTGGR